MVVPSIPRELPIIIPTGLSEEDKIFIRGSLSTLLSQISATIKSAPSPAALKELPTKFQSRVRCITPMGVDLSHLCSLLDRLASYGEDWEARHKVISEASGNSIASFTEGLKKIEVELASCLEIHKKKQAKLDLHKGSVGYRSFDPS